MGDGEPSERQTIGGATVEHASIPTGTNRLGSALSLALGAFGFAIGPIIGYAATPIVAAAWSACAEAEPSLPLRTPLLRPSVHRCHPVADVGGRDARHPTPTAVGCAVAARHSSGGGLGVNRRSRPDQRAGLLRRSAIRSRSERQRMRANRHPDVVAWVATDLTRATIDPPPRPTPS